MRVLYGVASSKEGKYTGNYVSSNQIKRFEVSARDCYDKATVEIYSSKTQQLISSTTIQATP
jgi:hypothetical protein